MQLCPNKQTVVEEIFLKEENFANLDKNSLPIKMFRDLFLSGGVGFDVSQLFSEGKAEQYVWLAANLIHARQLPSLRSFV